MTESAASRTHVERDRGREKTLIYKDIRGNKGSNIYTRAPQLFDHFLNGQLANADLTSTQSGYPLLAHETHGTTATTFLIDPTVLGGALVVTTSDTAGDAGTVASGLAFQCDTTAIGKPMFAEVRVKFGRVDGTVFFGFSDAQNETSDAPYALTVTDSTIATSAPSDAFGFLFSGDVSGGDFDSITSTATVLGGISTIGNTDTAFVPGVTTAFKSTARGQGGAGGYTYPSAAVTITSSTYYTLRVELDAAGNGTLFKDDAFFASFPAALTSTVPLCFNFNVITRASASTVATIDYFAVGGSL